MVLSLPRRGLSGVWREGDARKPPSAGKGFVPAPKENAMNKPLCDAFVFFWKTEAFFLFSREAP